MNQFGLSLLDFILHYQPLRPFYPLRKDLRVFLLCFMTLYMLKAVEAAPWDDSNFFAMNYRAFRQNSHRRPQILPFERPGRDTDRTCGSILTKRTQRICSMDCAPPGMSKIMLDKRGIQPKTMLTMLCCDKPCSDEVIRKIFCCSANP